MRLLHRLAPQRAMIIVLIFLSLGSVALNVIGPRILGHATDLLFSGVIGQQLPSGITQEKAITYARARGDNTFADMLSGMAVTPGQGTDFPALQRTLLLALAIYCIAAVTIWIQARLLTVIVQRTVRTLRCDVENKIHRLPLSYFDSQPRGELLSRMTNDVDNISSTISMTISQLVTSALTLIAMLLAMLTMSPLLTVLIIMTVPLSLWIVRIITGRSRRLFTTQWSTLGHLNAHLEETYSAIITVKTSGRQDMASEKFHELNNTVYRTSCHAQFVSGLMSPAISFIGNLGYVIVAVIGGYRVATGQITLGNVQAFIQYLRQFNQPLGQLAGMYNTLQSGMVSADRVFDFLDEPEMLADSLPSLTHNAGVAAVKTADAEITKGKIEFRHIWFSYQPGIPILKDVSFAVEAGSSVALVGHTGAGKTTVANLLMRFYDPDSGSIVFDDVDITRMNRKLLHSKIAIVLQDTWLFHGTIAENIAYGRPEASIDDVIEAARAAYVDQFICSLPDGYQTQINNDDTIISAGEKQLITIARAFAAQPDILILDEATSSVDTRTELRIQNAMNDLQRHRTSFTIAHRLSTIRNADNILVMRDGEIAETGTHTELLERRGIYWQMTLPRPAVHY